MLTVFQTFGKEIILKINSEISSQPGETIHLQSQAYHIDERETFIDKDENIAYVFTITKK